MSTDGSINTALIVAAVMSAVASLLHIAIVVGGPAWYRFFGAGETMALAAQSRRLYPTLVTVGIAVVFAVWAAYALSGAGVLPRLPYLRAALSAITSVYLLRGMVIFLMYVVARRQVTGFWIWSSAISLSFGLVHLRGVVQVWSRL